jgi:inner membrane protein
MKGISHAFIGASALVTIHAGIAPVAPNTFGLAVLAGAAAVSALLPDLDSDESIVRHATGTARSSGALGRVVSWLSDRLLGHRGMLHSLFMWLLLSLIAGIYFRGSMMWIAFGVGYASHLLADMLTTAGIPLLWPWRRRWHLLPSFVAIKTGSAAEYAATIIICMFAVGLLQHTITLPWR